MKAPPGIRRPGRSKWTRHRRCATNPNSTSRYPFRRTGATRHSDGLPRGKSARVGNQCLRLSRRQRGRPTTELWARSPERYRLLCGEEISSHPPKSRDEGADAAIAAEPWAMPRSSLMVGDHRTWRQLGAAALPQSSAPAARGWVPGPDQGHTPTARQHLSERRGEGRTDRRVGPAARGRFAFPVLPGRV